MPLSKFKRDGLVFVFIILAGVSIGVIFCQREKSTIKEVKVDPSKPEISTTSYSQDLEHKLETLWQGILTPGENRHLYRKEMADLGPVTIPFLLSHLSDDRWNVRWEVVNSLGMIGDHKATDYLIDRVLHDDNPHIRWRSLWALHALRNNEIPDKLRNYLDSKNELERWNAAVGLAFFSQRDAIPILQKGLISPDFWIRWEAVTSLGKVFDENTVELLIPLLNDSEPELQRETVKSIGRIGSPEAIKQLIALIDHSDPYVRLKVISFLKKEKDPSIQNLLEKRLIVEKDEKVLSVLNKTMNNFRNE